MALIDLVSQIIAEAVKARTDLCKAFSDIIAELSSLEVPEDQEQALLQATVEFNKSSSKIMERTEDWFNRVRVRLVHIDNVADVDELAGNGKKEVKQVETPDVDANGLAVSEEGSRRIPIHVPHFGPPPK